MGYPEVKQERYSLIGGINTTISRYLTGQQELIRLVNYDFSVPGSITKRADTSAFLGNSFGLNIQTIYEQTYFSGASYSFVWAFTNAYFSGNTTGVATFGASFPGYTGSLGYNFGAAGSGGVNFARISSINTVDNYWAANAPINFSIIPPQPGTIFVRWNASYGYFGNALMEQVTPGFQFGVTATAGAGGYFSSGNGYRYSLAYLNERGVVGPATPLAYRPYIQGVGATTATVFIPNLLTVGQPFRFVKNSATATMLLFRDTIGVTAAQLGSPDVAITTAVFSIPIAVGNTVLIDSGRGFSTSTFAGDTWLLNPQQVNDSLIQHDYWKFGGIGDVPWPRPLIPPSPMISASLGIKLTGEPRFLSVLNSMAVYGGFSSFPAGVFWSESDTPEWVANDNFAEVGTDSSNAETGQISYNNVVVIGKAQSLHEMTGTSPDNISIQVQTTQYGFMNNFSQCVFNNQLWFIDGLGKGIGQYNGANTEIVSVKVQDVFKRINLTAAMKTAFMLHVKQRNEVWAGIPVDGSEVVNVIVVYDYVANCWTTYEGLSPNCVTIARGTLNLPAVVMGFSNGDIRYMNATYTGSQFMTTAVRFPFVNNFGWSTTQVFRWLFLDVDPVVGVTHTFNANFYLDAGNAISLTRGITTSSYQTRTDFGLPGKGLSIELIEGSTLPCRINGYTVASRFQRQV